MRPNQNRTVGFEPSTDVRTATFAWLRWKDDDTRLRRRRAGKTTVEYGAYVTHRWQNDDVPAAYLPTAQPVDPFANGGSGVMARGFRATALRRLGPPHVSVGARRGRGRVPHRDRRSALAPPGRPPPRSGEEQADRRGPPDRLRPDRLDVHRRPRRRLRERRSRRPASAPSCVPNATAPQNGDLDGPQANPRRDNRVDNFRFHSDYRIDRILFREIIGTVTDAMYARPHARLRLTRTRSGELSATTDSSARAPSRRALRSRARRRSASRSIPSLIFQTHAFLAALEYAVLFPLAGLDNVATGQSGKPAQLVRLRLNYLF